jgi:hypothetical protein
VDEIYPGQPLVGINVLGWWEIFRTIETSNSDIDLIGTFSMLIRERGSTVRAKGPPGSGLRLIPMRRSLYELEARTL